ncbi:signal recognition particle receptor beta subunit-domain-containing protein [Syncephalis plumigaleata]|nr:signal recognition particle receptor beta subunit-domain-containing protein [Syncephalis plumigaleata]
MFTLVGDYTTWLLLLALISVVVVVVVVIGRGRQQRADAFLLLGPCSSGKTNMLARLSNDIWVDTQTSLKENTMLVNLQDADGNELVTRVIDVPGHEKLRYQLHHFTPIARAIIFVLDASRLSKDVRKTAEYLYDVLSDRHLIEREVPVLLACHKSDLATAYTPERCRTMLEAEM